MSLRVLSAALVLGLAMSGSARAQFDTRTEPTGNRINGVDIVARIPDGPADGGFSIKQDDPDTGSNVRRRVVTGSPLPFDESWSGLTAQQKQIVRARYEKIPDNQEPPFPVDGLYSVYRPVSNLIADFTRSGRLTTLGELSLGVVVAPDGRPTSVLVFKTPDKALSDTLAQALMDVRFKPGVCDGKPCQMEFPIDLVMIHRSAVN